MRPERELAGLGAPPGRKTFSSFPFAAYPGVDRHLAVELAAATFVERAEDVLALGPASARTHLAVALAQAARRAGRTVLVVGAATLGESLARARDEGSFRAKVQRYLEPDLLIVDDVEEASDAPATAEVLALVALREGQRSTVLTAAGPSSWTARLQRRAHVLAADASTSGLRAWPRRPERSFEHAERAAWTRVVWPRRDEPARTAALRAG